MPTDIHADGLAAGIVSTRAGLTAVLGPVVLGPVTAARAQCPLAFHRPHVGRQVALGLGGFRGDPDPISVRQLPAQIAGYGQRGDAADR